MVGAEKPGVLSGPTAIRYCVSGLFAALLYFAVTTFLVASLNVGVFASGVGGYAFATPCAYLLHRHYTFRSTASRPLEITKFLVTTACGAVMSGIVPDLLYPGTTSLPVSLIVTSVLVPVFNFILSALWVFRAHG